LTAGYGSGELTMRSTTALRSYVACSPDGSTANGTNRCPHCVVHYCGVSGGCSEASLRRLETHGRKGLPRETITWTGWWLAGLTSYISTAWFCTPAQRSQARMVLCKVLRSRVLCLGLCYKFMHPSCRSSCRFQPSSSMP